MHPSFSVLLACSVSKNLYLFVVHSVIKLFHVCDSLQYIGPECEHEVNLDARSKAGLIAAVASGDITPSLFDKVAAVLEKEMAGDMLPRFISSPFWRAVVEPLRKEQSDGSGGRGKRSASEERSIAKAALVRVRAVTALRCPLWPAWCVGVCFLFRIILKALASRALQSSFE